jgi:hypothetical protein
VKVNPKKEIKTKKIKNKNKNCFWKVSISKSAGFS